ncbi:MAG: NAD(P)/FAD-dependent oxidoreductase, partial [Actinobacteria bacterium]|nr:NAD(P)/FAD-dependent oxidoreductase [Actinomycetota bacterium]
MGDGRLRVVVIGAGFAGLAAVKELAHADADVDVMLVDRHNYNTFQPLLYQVATAGLDAGDVGHHIRGVIRDWPRVDLLVGTVTHVDPGARKVVLSNGDTMSYDALVITAGARTNFFGVPGAQEHGLPLYTLADAVRVRNHVLSCFEAAEADPSLVDGGMLTFVVVGGGPTGVETAGAMSELFRYVIRRDFRHIDTARARIVLVEMTDHVLGTFRPKSRQHAREQLEARGVELRFGSRVTAIEPTRVTLDSGDAIPTHTVIWAAGVQANQLTDDALPRTQGGRIVVNPDLSVPGHPDVFVAGDLAGANGPDGKVLPQLARPAMEGGRHAAIQVLRRRAGLATLPFRYRDPGTMATIGRRSAVADLRLGITLTGGVAWLAWLGLHLVELTGGIRRRTEILV